MQRPVLPRHLEDSATPGLERAFGEVLRAHRRALKLSQEEFAVQLGMDRTYISLIERGLRRPSLGAIFAFARFFNMRASDLIRETEECLPPPPAS
ncbi:MAG TPA: helix-turn-helix transcriptional regulator [Candidatus Kapabacteria bacterium]|nr:helix-turn-helix transcriptional regulator [Candidatus Kapabacteria bacterium]